MVISNTTSSDVSLENVRLNVSRLTFPANADYEISFMDFWPWFFSDTFVALIDDGTLTIAQSSAGSTVRVADDDFNTTMKSIFSTVGLDMFNT